MHPPPELKTDDVLIYFVTADTDGVIYTDLTGKFPIISRTGNKYVMVLYHYDSNTILFWALKSRSDEEALKAYADLYDYLKMRNCAPRLNILDNEASKAVKRYILKSGTTYQLVEP